MVSLAKFILNVTIRKAVLNCYLDSFTKPRVVGLRLIFGIHILRIIVKQPKVIKSLNMGKLSIQDWLNDLGYLCIMKYYTAIKNNGALF